MKKQTLFISAIFISVIASAQLEKPGLRYNKEQLDSLFRNHQRLNQPFVIPAPKENALPNELNAKTPNRFETLNPGAIVLNRTNRGTIYKMPPDNMAVLVPDMNVVERTPFNGNQHPDKMPNPLHKKKIVPGKNVIPE